MPDSTKLVESWKPKFRAAYDADDRNAAHQPFDEYWSWITTFLLKGGAGQAGWLDQVEKALRRVHDEDTAAHLRARLLDIGKTIAAEWAKQGRYRRIHSTMLQGTPNLMDLGARLQRASAREEGDGLAIEDALDRIEKDVNSALGR